MLIVISQYSAALGNQRPAGLQSVEKELWKTLFGIVSGKNVQSQLNGFLQTFDVISSTMGQEFIDNWFSVGKSVYIHNDHHVLIHL